jgi:NTE family protein
MIYNKYFSVSSWFTLGVYAELLLSDQDVFSNYTATILRTPAFEPIPEMSTLFLPKYRALDYAGLGLQPIFNVFRNFDVRLEGYLFQPYEELIQSESQQTLKGDPLDSRSWALSGSLIYYLRYMPISLSFNYYDQGADKFSVLFNVGFIIFNKSALN